MWRVTAPGAVSGTDYVYEVQAPETATRFGVLDVAFSRHVSLLWREEVGEYLDVSSSTVEYVPCPANGDVSP